MPPLNGQSAPSSPLPASLLRAEAREGDLDARIRQAEQRLIAREENLRRGVSALGGRVRDALQPRRLAGPLLGAVLAGAGLWWFVRGRTPAPTFATAGLQAGGDGKAGSHGSGTPWVRMVGLVWPLLPVALRSRVSPGTVSVAMSLGVPLLERLFTPRRPAPLPTAGPLDPALLDGDWYEVARLPALHGAAAAAPRPLRYRLRGDGLVDVLEQRTLASGRVQVLRGVARPVRGSGGARRRVSLWPAWLRWLSLAWRDEWILHVDDAGSELLIGSPRRDTLRVLSRRPWLPPDRLRALAAIALDRGFAVERLQVTDPG